MRKRSVHTSKGDNEKLTTKTSHPHKRRQSGGFSACVVVSVVITILLLVLLLLAKIGYWKIDTLKQSIPETKDVADHTTIEQQAATQQKVTEPSHKVPVQETKASTKATRKETELSQTHAESNTVNPVKHVKAHHSTTEQVAAISYTAMPLDHVPRFPRYGTKEFFDKCGWATSYARRLGRWNCTIYMVPDKNWGEGYSAWISKVCSEHMKSQLLGCNLLLDYGKGVVLTDIVLPQQAASGIAISDGIEESIENDVPMNWTVPNNFRCSQDEHCFVWKVRLPAAMQKDFLHPPEYRFAYQRPGSPVKSTDPFKALFEKRGVELDLETGFACSFESLFRLPNPQASAFEPELFTTLLPTLQSSFVITLYVRAGAADHANYTAILENDAAKMQREQAHVQVAARAAINCALELEKQQLQLQQDSKVAWLVITDAPILKVWMQETYGTTASNGRRKILTSSARGMHTKASSNPSTQDFAEAMIDWILMGESNVVITSEKFTFGGTAAMRTARPYYHANATHCGRVTLVHDQ